jgi:hypothetical protein
MLSSNADKFPQNSFTIKIKNIKTKNSETIKIQNGNFDANQLKTICNTLQVDYVLVFNRIKADIAEYERIYSVDVTIIDKRELEATIKNKNTGKHKNITIKHGNIVQDEIKQLCEQLGLNDSNAVYVQVKQAITDSNKSQFAIFLAKDKYAPGMVNVTITNKENKKEAKVSIKNNKIEWPKDPTLKKLIGLSETLAEELIQEKIDEQKKIFQDEFDTEVILTGNYKNDDLPDSNQHANQNNLSNTNNTTSANPVFAYPLNELLFRELYDNKYIAPGISLNNKLDDIKTPFLKVNRSLEGKENPKMKRQKELFEQQVLVEMDHLMLSTASDSSQKAFNLIITSQFCASKDIQDTMIDQKLLENFATKFRISLIFDAEGRLKTVNDQLLLPSELTILFSQINDKLVQNRDPNDKDDFAYALHFLTLSTIKNADELKQWKEKAPSSFLKKGEYARAAQNITLDSLKNSELLESMNSIVRGLIINHSYKNVFEAKYGDFKLTLDGHTTASNQSSSSVGTRSMVTNMAPVCNSSKEEEVVVVDDQNSLNKLPSQTH